MDLITHLPPTYHSSHNSLFIIKQTNHLPISPSHCSFIFYFLLSSENWLQQVVLEWERLWRSLSSTLGNSQRFRSGVWGGWVLGKANLLSKRAISSSRSQLWSLENNCHSRIFPDTTCKLAFYWVKLPSCPLQNSLPVFLTHTYQTIDEKLLLLCFQQ